MNAELFTLPGSPIIYYGDEIGMGDNIWLEDRNGVRTPMQWDSSPNGGFSAASETYAPVIEDDIFGYQKVNVHDQRSDPMSFFNAIKHMIRVRKKYQAFGLGTFTFCLPNNEAVLAYWREYETEKILCVFNLSDETQSAVFDLPSEMGKTPLNVLSGDSLPKIAQAELSLTLDPYGYIWLKF